MGVSSLRLACSAIRAGHIDYGLPDPTRHGTVTTLMAGLVRALGRPRRQVAGLTADALEQIVEAAPDSPAGRLDVALCRTMRDAMLRRSEAASLTWGDIEAAPDGSGRLTVQRSKTDQAGVGTVLYLSTETMHSLAAIRPEGAARAAPVFALRGRRPPHPDSLAKRIRNAALRAGLGDGFAGHSPRVGMARDLTAAGVELPALMVAGRWTSTTMPALYARREQAERGAVARYYETH